MKKRIWILTLTLAAALALSAPTLAATLGIALEDGVYAIPDGQGTYQEDGKTFIVEGNSVTIREAGKPDRILPIEGGTGDTVVQDVPAYESVMATENGAYVTEAISEEAIASPSAVAREGTGYADPEKYGKYARLGLSHDAAEDALYYQGQRVRIFEDGYPIGENASVVTEHFDEKGMIDVAAERDLSARVYQADGSYDPGGTLTGLRVLTADEFAGRDLSPWTSPPGQMTQAASEGEPMRPEEKEILFALYASLGLHYDAQRDRLTYQGKVVRRFLDIQRSNGESLSGGHFRGTMTSITDDAGEIDITILRDYGKPDAHGDGTITGLRAEEVK